MFNATHHAKIEKMTQILFSDEVLGDYKSWNGNPIFMLRGRCLTQASTEELLAERLTLENEGQPECTIKLFAVMGMIMMKESCEGIIEQLNRQLQKHCLCAREKVLSEVCLVLRTIISEFAKVQDFPAQEIMKFTATLSKTPEAACTTIKSFLEWHSKKRFSLHQLDAENINTVQSALKDLNVLHTKLERMTSYILQSRKQCPEILERVLQNVSNIYHAQEKIQVSSIACALDIVTMQLPNSSALHDIHSRLWPLLKTKSITIMYMETHTFMIENRKICVMKWATDKEGFNVKGAAVRYKLLRGNQLSSDCILFSFPLYSAQEIRESRQDQLCQRSLEHNMTRNWKSFEDSLKQLTANSDGSCSAEALTIFCCANPTPFNSKFALKCHFNCDGILLQEAINSRFHEAIHTDYITSNASENLHPASHFDLHFQAEKFNKGRLLSLVPSLEYTDLVQASCDVYGDLKNADRSVPGCSPDRISSGVKMSKRIVDASSTRALICLTLSRQSSLARKELEERLAELDRRKAIPSMQSESLKADNSLASDRLQSKRGVLNSKKSFSERTRDLGIPSDSAAKNTIQDKNVDSDEQKNDHEIESAALSIEDQHLQVREIEIGNNG